MNLLKLLREQDELTLIELLGITSDDIVDSFQDRIEENFEHLYKELNYDSEEDQDR